MDEESLITTMKLLQQDIGEALENRKNRKGKEAEGKSNDEELALRIHQEDLEALQASLQDSRIARSISRAVEEDAPAIAAILQEENAAVNDQRIALSPGQHVPRLQAPEPQELYRKTLDMFFKIDVADESSEGERSTSQTKAQVKAGDSQNNTDEFSPEPLRLECVICLETKVFFDIIETPCFHYYCRACIRKLFEKSFTDDTLFPPRCCRQPIALSRVAAFLGEELVKRFQEKSVEYNDTNRTYCSNPTCSLYMSAEAVELDVAECGACGTTTCVHCKKPAHSGECDGDKIEQAFMELVQAEGWRECYKCHRVIELRAGCNHVTCHCGAGFCYVCNKIWKTCRCEQWVESRLFERDHQLVARERRPDERPPSPEVGIRRIREWHECDHTGHWYRVKGLHQCEECMSYFPRFIFRCQQCQLSACVNCKLNRL
ncbi:IBR domain-containing protein [Paracoccidioides lutzii Pb01]|uniref:RBR-type E3 ubiquitin transferase n=1 Tax=Paracoccidioides lutzii (strain ATCC MYA-826 / Pb01) TaxID=502779 RepID=C1HBR1_PARBA|nr:IBR domain-containing protein [Paracoccidioides lutzii Pb01]EEH38475.2 IBR domain-containing protein [Paracoccidioides lutzii Pb01]